MWIGVAVVATIFAELPAMTQLIRRGALRGAKPVGT